MLTGGVEVYSYSFFNLGARWVWVVNATPQPLCSRGWDNVPTVQEVGWASGPVWTAAENLPPTGILSPDRPASSESLYRLHYSNPPWGWVGIYVLVMLCTGVPKVSDLSHRLVYTSCSSPTRKFVTLPSDGPRVVHQDSYLLWCTNLYCSPLASEFIKHRG